MDWATTKNRVGRRARVLIAASGILCATVYLLHLLIAVSPLLYFEGFVTGYYSLLDYRLVYSHNGNSVAMPHTDYTRHISLTYAMVSLAMLTLSIVSIALVVGKRLLGPAGLIYGVASSLIPTYSLLYGFLYRVMALDLGRFTHLNSNGGELVFRTNAGIIVYEGISINPTPIYIYILRNTALLTILTATAVAVSATSIVLAMLRLPRTTTAVQIRPALLYRLRGSTIHIALSALTLLSLASIFTYYPTSVYVVPQPPPATLETPPYTYTCTGLPRTARGAIAYTDFETYPVSGWTSSGGSWSSTLGGGFKGNAIQGIDNNRGIGSASQYYWNTKIDGYTNLWVSVKVRLASGSESYRGLALINSVLNSLYEISVYNGRVYLYRCCWTMLTSATITNYVAGAWYTIISNYVVTPAAITFYVWVYDVNGVQVAYFTYSDRAPARFIPAYAGLEIDTTTGTATIYFDDFVASTTDPRNISFTGFTAGMMVEVWDNLGNLVGSATAPAAPFSLGVVNDLVVGTGSNGRIVVRYPNAYLCGALTVPTADAILGGDTYSLSISQVTVLLGANRTSATLSIYVSGSSIFTPTSRFLRLSTSQALYARLILDSVSAPSTLNLDIWVEGATRSTNVTIRSGVPSTTSTSVVMLNLGSNNFLALSGYFMATDQTATINLKLELCTVPGSTGACVYYPIRLEVKSSGSASGSIYSPFDGLEHQFYGQYLEYDLVKEAEGYYYQNPVFESVEGVEIPGYVCGESESFCSREPIGDEENH